MQVIKHASEGIHPGFQTLKRCYQKSKIEVSVVQWPRREEMFSKYLYKKEKFWHNMSIEFRYFGNSFLRLLPKNW